MHFRILNIPVQIQPTFWLFALFFSRMYENPSPESLIAAIILLFSLLVHEYGHALTAVYFGASPTVTLEAFGGNCSYDDRQITPRQSFLITLGGPLLESVLIVIPYFLLKSHIFDGHYYIQYFLYVTMRLNILWCLLNLIPISPLDGGHLASYLLERKFGHAGHRASIILGLVCVVFVAPYLFYKNLFFFGALLLFLGFRNWQALQSLKSELKEVSPFSAYSKALTLISDDQLDQAKDILKRILKKSEDVQVKNFAIESLAKIYAQQGQDQKSYNLLLTADPQYLTEGKCLLCKLAFDRQNYNLISQYSREIYDIEPTFEIALLNSKAFACLKQPVPAGAWLLTASQFGTEYLESIKSTLLHQIYDVVKKQDTFKKYVEQIPLHA
ncbi:MAG: site-2 protease family protein [Chlamydiales bacterium]|nr:site-2 protease family protein [Chlamydiales bacterium]